MYSLGKICVVCLNRKEQYHKILIANADAQILRNLHTCEFVTDFLEANSSLRICNKCVDTLEVACEFIELCRKSNLVLRDSIDKNLDNNHELLEYTDNEVDNNVDELMEEKKIVPEVADGPIQDEEFKDITHSAVQMKSIQSLTIEQCDIKQENVYELMEETVLEKVEHFTVKGEMLPDPLDSVSLEIEPEPVEYIDCEDDGINQESEGLIEPITNEKEKMCSEKYLDIQCEFLSCMDTDVRIIYNQQALIPTNNAKVVRTFVSSEIKCYICGILLTCKADLKTHMTVHTTKHNNECTICKKKLSKSIYLKRHMLIHAAEKKYQCTICEKRFTQSSALKVHERVHTGERNYTCAVCMRSFSRLDKLKTHMSTHTGEKKYQCSVCEKRFTQSGTLKIHMRIHTGEMKYLCAVCMRRFARLDKLKAHMLIHAGEENYHCTVCEKKFTRPDYLRKHMRIHTRDEN